MGKRLTVRKKGCVTEGVGVCLHAVRLPSFVRGCERWGDSRWECWVQDADIFSPPVGGGPSRGKGDENSGPEICFQETSREPVSMRLYWVCIEFFRMVIGVPMHKGGRKVMPVRACDGLAFSTSFRTTNC